MERASRVDADRQPGSAGRWDDPGVLSIVVQGPLFQGNMIETALNCRHWRTLFPTAEIVFAISVTDIVFGSVNDGVLTDIRLVARHRHDGHLQAALAEIVASCDRVGLSAGAVPLPPIKSDSPKLNNMNLQIAAAQRGLGLVSGRFVLRIRSDITFATRHFLDQYEAADALPRRDAAVFKRRVLISWLFTLNPFTVERLPFHFSDWFHFGLLEDVRRIWNVPPITLADATFYRTNRHAPGSNVAERLFNIRLAVEQHLVFNCMKSDFPSMRLDYHNDPSSRALSLDILVDNFAICDLVAAHCGFDKYSGEFMDESKLLHCINAHTWRALAKQRPAEYDRITSTEWSAMARPDGLDLALDGDDAGPGAPAPAARGRRSRRDFSRTFEAGALRTSDGRFMNGEIVATGPQGVLFYGPYVTLAPGRYVAAINATTLEGPGELMLKVTKDSGKVTLARAAVKISDPPPPVLQIPFEISDSDAANVEVVCRFKDLKGMAVSGITITERSGAGPARPKWLNMLPAVRF